MTVPVSPPGFAPVPRPVPAWLVQRLRAAGGQVSFLTFMEWVLHDPLHGAYGRGRLRIGPQGDFVTAPALGDEFAALLAPQIADWLEQIPGPLALVEAGPGEGQLAAQVSEAVTRQWPALARRLELVLVEPNAGMALRQRQRLAGCGLPCRWVSFRELAQAPVRGVILAHEVLDALAVERIVWDGGDWRRQEVALVPADDPSPQLALTAGATLEAAELEPLLALMQGQPPPGGLPSGWCTEVHPGLAPWLAEAAAALDQGQLLVIDYALEAWRYYAPARANGTLMAYRNQQASSDPLQDPGEWDLTAHLCIDSLEAAARATGWQPLGGCRQGEALLALGLAGRLHGLQRGEAGPLAELLGRREALLRLVDPHALGDFRWLAYGRGPGSGPRPRFLQEPDQS